MRTDDFHLERLLLIDSYREGDIVEVRLDGHANINGVNAAGKTTLLRTIPLFYGENASRMLKGEQGKKAFTDHYLPRTTSYIVFEYARRGQLSMVVLHANATGESIQYRFIASGYRKDLFVVGQSIVESNTQILRHVEKQGLPCTRALTRAEYRSIIQNDVDRRELRTLAAQFAFVGSASRLSHIDRIVTGMFVRATTFRDLRAIIVSSITKDEGQLEIRAQRDQMEIWIRDHDAYLDVMKEVGRVTELVEASKRRQSALAALSLAKGQLMALEQARATQLRDVKEALRALDAKADAERADLTERTARVKGRLSAKDEELKRAQEQLTRLDATAQRYRDQGLEKRARDQQDLPSLQGELEAQEKSHQALLGSQRSVSEKYEHLELLADKQANAKIAEFEKARAPIYDEMDRLRCECEEHHQALEKALREEHDQALEAVNEDVQACAERLGWLNSRINDAQASPELLTQKEAKDEECEQARRDVERARKQRDEAQRARITARTAFDEADRQANRIRTRLQEHEAALQAATQMGEGAPGTLIHFLRANVPDWRENIGKIASRELLLRADLLPEPDASTHASFYGVQLRLDRIETPWHAQEETIEERIAQLKGDIAAEQKRSALQEAALAQAGATRDTAANAEQDASRHYQTQEERLARLTGEQQSLKRQIDESRARAKKQADEDLKEAQAQKLKLDKEVKQLRAIFDRAVADHVAARQRALSALETTKKEKLGQIGACIEAAKADRLAAREQLRQERHLSLASEGIDPQTLARLEKAIDSLRERIERIRNDAPEVAGYQGWLKGQWPLRPGYVEQLESIQRAIRELTDEDARARADSEKRQASLQKEHVALESQEHRIDGELSAVKARLDKLGYVVEDRQAAQASHDAAHTLAYLDEVKRTNESALSEAEKRIEDDVAVILRAFTKHRGTAPDRFYESYRSDLSAHGQRGREWLPAINEWFDSRHLEARRVLRDGASLLGQTVDDFYNALKTFKTRSQGFSRELQACIDSSADFDKITNVQARIQTRVDALDYWGSISALSEEFRLWIDRQDDDLPHQEFCQALRRVSQSFQGDRTLSADLVDLIQLEIDLVENGRHVTVRDERQLEHVSSNGISYLILIVIFLAFLQRVRKDAPVQVLCAVDELKNLDLPNTERLFNLLDRHRVTLISAFPDADPEVLRLFQHRYTVLEGRRIAQVVLDEDLSDEPQTPNETHTPADGDSPAVTISEAPAVTLEEDADHV